MWPHWQYCGMHYCRCPLWSKYGAYIFKRRISKFWRGRCIFYIDPSKKPPILKLVCCVLFRWRGLIIFWPAKVLRITRTYFKQSTRKFINWLARTASSISRHSGSRPATKVDNHFHGKTIWNLTSRGGDSQAHLNGLSPGPPQPCYLVRTRCTAAKGVGHHIFRTPSTVHKAVLRCRHLVKDSRGSGRAGLDPRRAGEKQV